MNRKEPLKILGFFAVALLVTRLASIVYGAVVMSNSLAERTERQLADAPHRIEVLITGDSHSKCGIDPEVFRGAFNYGLFNESYLKTYYKLRSLLDRADKDIGAVIIPLDLHSFASYRFDEFDPLHYWARYLDFPEVGRRRGRRIQYILTGVRGRFFSYVDNDQNVFWFLDNELLTPSGQGLKMRAGYTPLHSDFAAQTQEHRTREIDQRIGRHFGEGTYFDEDMADYFLDLLELCHQNHAQVALVSLPIPKEYFEVAAKKIPVDELESRVSAMLEKYPDVVRLDYRQAFFDRTELFADADHLNHKGATVLSQMLRDDLAAELLPRYGM